MTNTFAGQREPFEFSMRGIRVSAPIGPYPVVSSEQINDAISAQIPAKSVPSRSRIQRLEDFLGRYFAAGYCLAR